MGFFFKLNYRDKHYINSKSLCSDLSSTLSEDYVRSLFSEAPLQRRNGVKPPQPWEDQDENKIFAGGTASSVAGSMWYVPTHTCKKGGFIIFRKLP